jgi:membrane-bound inhibitor of C-type lysozyme
MNDWQSVRSYTIEDAQLVLSLTDSGGNYEFEPSVASKVDLPKSPVRSRGPFEFQCAHAGGDDILRATYYETRPGLLLVERGGQTRPAFRVQSGSGVRYVGADITFWEWHGQATVNWSGTQLNCKHLHRHLTISVFRPVTFDSSDDKS